MTRPPTSPSSRSGSGASDHSPYLPVIQAQWLAAEPKRTRREVDGTLVFADISGFTPLSERLATRGKVGAEELTATLNGVFGRFVDVAESHGGDLLKFGGDALLFLFTGDDHAVRACAAAAALQKGLRPFRRVRTDAGTVSLHMSVGVSSGPVHLFLVGGSHRELVVAGPVTTAVAEQEAQADADEILLAPTTWEHVPRDVLGGEKGDARLLRSAPQVESSPIVRPPPGAHLSAGVPPSLRGHLQGGRDQGEHRVIVLAFLQFRGTDDLIASSGPAAVATALDGLVRAVQDSATEFGVHFLATDLDRNGGKIILVAGAPAASTDDEDRMLHAVLRVLEAPLALPLRVGVNRGRAFAVEVGPPQRRIYTVMGDAINVAARVMGRAELGTMVATAAVLDHVKGDFELERLVPFTVKGKTTPVEAAVVRAAAASRTQVEPAGPTMVGRAVELATLRTSAERAWTGDGRVVQISGEPGIGKSRLVTELITCERGAMDLLAIAGAPYTVHNPYVALRAPLRRLVGVAPDASPGAVEQAVRGEVAALAPHLQPWLPLLALPFGLELPDTPQTAEIDAAFRAARLHTLFGDLLNHLLPGPALIVIEDAHWLDAATTELVERLVRDVATRPWLVCVTRRDGDGGLHLPAGPNTLALPLEPLGAESARALLRPALEERPLPAATVAALVERSGGNPLFLQELWAAAARGGDIAELPDTVEALIASRIDTLARSDRTVLRHAAVIGQRFSKSVLAALDEDDAEPIDVVLARLGSFVASEGDGHFQFRHALLREVAYEGLAFRERRRLHARVGELLVAQVGEDLEEWSHLLSLHFSAAQRDTEAWRFSRMAGDRARRQSSAGDAAVFYRRALDAGQRLPDLSPVELAAVWEALGDVGDVAGTYEEAARAFRHARRLAVDDPLRTIDLYRKEGWLRERSARYSEALRWYTRGLRALERLPESAETARERAKLILGYGVARLRQGRYRECVPLVEQAARDAEALGDLETLGHAYYILDWALTDMGSDEALQYRKRALPIFEKLGDLVRQGNVYNNLGIGAYYAGRWDEAMALYEQARDAWDRAGDAVQMGTAANNIAEILSDQGHLADAEILFRDALVVWRAARFPVGIALATSNLGRLAMRQGDLATAARLLAEARQSFTEIGAEGLALETDAREAERLVATGEPDAALALIEPTAARLEKLGAVLTLLAALDRVAGCALALLGRRDPAVVRLWRALERAGTDAYQVAQTLQVLDALGAPRGPGGPPVDPSEPEALFAGLGVVVTPPALVVRPPRDRNPM